MSDDSQVWVSSPQAAAALGVTTNHIGWLGKQGQLVVEHRDGRRWVLRESLDALLSVRERWITLPEAGKMLGRSAKTARRLAMQGRIRQRDTDGTRSPSVDRSSVEAYMEGQGG